MPTINLNRSYYLGGINFTFSQSLTGNSSSGLEDTLTAGKLVTAWVKTDADTAACNLPAGHGYSSGKMDVMWNDGANCRYGVDGTVSTNALTLDGGAGDDFPASATADVIVCTPQTFDVDFTITSVLVLLSVICDQACHVSFRDASHGSELELTQVADDLYEWKNTQASPFTASDPIGEIVASNGSATDATLKVGWLLTA